LNIISTLVSRVRVFLFEPLESVSLELSLHTSRFVIASSGSMTKAPTMFRLYLRVS